MKDCTDSRHLPREEDLSSYRVSDLLVLHGRLNEELRSRGVVRTANNPTGDLAEYLFCKAFEWKQAQNSACGFDATDGNGVRYQIKGRRIHRRNKSRQLSAIRNLSAEPFDVLAAVLFDDDFRILRAALIPRAVVVKRSTFIAHTNSNKFMLRDDVWHEIDVQDVTVELRGAVETERGESREIQP